MQETPHSASERRVSVLATFIHQCFFCFILGRRFLRKSREEHRGVPPLSGPTLLSLLAFAAGRLLVILRPPPTSPPPQWGDCEYQRLVRILRSFFLQSGGGGGEGSFSCFFGDACKDGTGKGQGRSKSTKSRWSSGRLFLLLSTALGLRPGGTGGGVEPPVAQNVVGSGGAAA